MIHNKAAAQIDQASSILHCREFFFAKQILVLRFAVDVQSDHVSGLQQFAEAYRAGISPRQHVRHIAEHHAHPQGFRQI